MFKAYTANVDSDDCVEIKDTEFLQNISYSGSAISSSTALATTVSISSDEISSKSSSDEDDDISKALEVYESNKKPVNKKEIYYIDTEPRKEYLKMNEGLPRRCLPLYRLSRYKLISGFYSQKKFKRYFKYKEKKSKKRNPESTELDRDEEMRLYLSKNQNDVDKWIEYVTLKELTSTKTADETEKLKLEVIEKALHFNASSKDLIELYLEVLPKVHTFDVVSNKIQDMISKDQHNLFYWKHLLKNLLCSMSCNAERGLKQFEKAFRIIQKGHDSDHSILQLFKFCCLFLRQAGLNEQFFALIHLMISMNVNCSNEFDKVFYTKEIQNPHLSEYEELILASELPMNELWFRMETIRSICNFLPVRVTMNSQQEMQDPQRYVFSEDICNLVFPLKNSHAFRFDLFMIVLKLLKYPMPYNNIKNELFITDDDRELEDGMSFLSILLEKTIGSENFNCIFFTTIKDLNISPNYLSYNVEYESFLNCIFKILETCGSSFTDRQNKLVLIMWLRLQRLMIVIDELKFKAEKKQQDAAEFAKYKKQIKSRVKNILKTSKYQNDLNVYVEYALIEGALGDEESCDKILKMSMSTASESYQHGMQSELDYYQIIIEFCERMMIRNERDECITKLKELTHNCDNPVAYFNSKIEETRDEECDEIEDIFMPNSNKLNLIKAKIYYQLLTRNKKIALLEILKYIDAAKETNLIKEKLYELYVKIYHLKINDELMNMRTYTQIVTRALANFPKNLFIMHAIASQLSFRWFDVRKLLLKTPTNESIFYLLVASKYREENFTDDDSKIYQHRIFNTIEGLINRRTTKGVSSILTWRLYLRAAFNYDFTKCKRILYELLDSNPMIKQLYLDGARYLPEEHSHLHDLIIEKGLRTHAIAEELEILRSK